MGAVRARVRCWRRDHLGSVVALGAVAAIVLGATLALIAGAARTDSAVDRKLDSLVFQADAELEQFGGPAGVDELLEVPAVADAEMATFFFGGITEPGVSEPAEGILFVTTSLAPLTNDGLLAGRMPSGEDPGEFVATPTYVENLGAELGDRFELITIGQEEAGRLGFDGEPNDFVVPATLVGIIDEGVAALESDFPFGAFDLSLLEEGDIGLAGGAGLVDLAAGSSIEDLREQLDESDIGQYYGVGPVEPISEDVRTAVSAQAQGVAVLALIVGSAAVLVLGQVFSRQLRLTDEERTVLRAVGFTPAQLALDPIARAAIAVGAGALAAIGIAYVASGAFPVGFARTVEPFPGLAFDARVLLAGGAALALAVLAVLAVLLAGPRSTVIARPSPHLERIVAAIPWSRASNGVRFAFGRGTRTGSTAGSMISLVAVSALVIGALTFGANLDRVLDDPARYGDLFDLGFGQGGDTIPPEVIDALAESPDVSAMSLFGATTVSVGTESLGIVAFEPVRGGVVPDVIEGRLPQSDDEMAIGNRAAADFGIDIGDELEMTAPSGDVSFRIVGIAVIGAVEDSDLAGQNALVTGGGLLVLDPEDALSSIGFDIAPGAPPGAVERLSEQLDVSLGPGDTPSNVANLGRVRTVPYAVAALVGTLTVLTLGHLLLVAVRRRGRDVAVLRACGATSAWVGSVVHWQATLTTILALVLATPLGFAGGALLYAPYADGIGARTDSFAPLGWLLLVVAVLVVLANVVAAVPAWRLRRTSLARLLTGT